MRNVYELVRMTEHINTEQKLQISALQNDLDYDPDSQDETVTSSCNRELLIGAQVLRFNEAFECE